MLSFSDSRNFTRTLAAISLILAPLMLLAASIIGPDLGDNYTEELANIADNEAAYVTSGILFLLAPLVLVPGLMGVFRLMRRRGVTLGQVGAAMVMFGALITMAFYGWGAIEYVAATESGLDRAQMAELFDAAEDSALGIPIWVGGFILGLTLGSILLAVALWRNRVVPVWSPIALVLSTIIGFVGGEDKWITAASFVLLLIALWPLAQKLLAISDDEWEDWHLPEPGTASSSTPPAASGGTPPP